jgi:hypothetical protein
VDQEDTGHQGIQSKIWVDDMYRFDPMLFNMGRGDEKGSGIRRRGG